MNILNINYSDIVGGASIAGYRLHLEFNKQGKYSRILVGYKKTLDENINTIVPSNKYSQSINTLLHRFFDRISYPNTFYLSSLFLKHNKWINSWANVIVLRNIHGGYLSEKMLPYLASKLPIVWRLADMWAVTGHCAFAYECEGWRKGCIKCPDINRYYPLRKDAAHRLWLRKKQIVQSIPPSRITIVTPSEWLRQIALESPIFKGIEVVKIPVGIDETEFVPLAKNEAKKKLGIKHTEIALIFGSQQVSDRRKGGHLILPIVNAIADKIGGSLVVITFGDNSCGLGKFSSNIRRVDLGEISENRKLCEAYSAANVYILPALADNLPNTLLEAMSCETPCVVFDTGGCKEVVRDRVSGFVVEQGNVDLLVQKISVLLKDQKLRKEFGIDSRRIIMEEFTMKKQAQSYIELIEKKYAIHG